MLLKTSAALFGTFLKMFDYLSIIITLKFAGLLIACLFNYVYTVASKLIYSRHPVTQLYINVYVLFDVFLYHSALHVILYCKTSDTSTFGFSL